jgi:hypothetical protein
MLSLTATAPSIEGWAGHERADMARRVNDYGHMAKASFTSVVLETYRYESLEEIMTALAEKVIMPAELKANELLGSMRR